MRIVTGSDGSLGSVLMRNYGGIGMDEATMRGGKSAIDCFIDKLSKSMKITEVTNNFGVNHLSWIGETPADDADLFTYNVMAPYWVINALVRNNQTCRVVNVASATHRVPQRCTTLYCASKAALVQMTKVMARELAPKGWIINAIAPGMIEDTKMSEMTNLQVMKLRGWGEVEMKLYATNLIPMGRATNAEEVAEAIEKVYELPDYINGSCIDMMGGV